MSAIILEQLKNAVVSLREAKCENDVIHTINELSNIWTIEDIDKLIDTVNGEPIQKLQYICTKAFEINNIKLYHMFVMTQIMPYEIDYYNDDADDDEKWEYFVDKLFRKPNYMIYSSFRFFQKSQHINMLKPHLEDIINNIEDAEVCNIKIAICSSVRIIAYLSDESKRSRNLHIFVSKVLFGNVKWHGNTKAKHYYSIMIENPNIFEDKDEWREHRIRNLLIESIFNGLYGQINYMTPTTQFCLSTNTDINKFMTLLDASE